MTSPRVRVFLVDDHPLVREWVGNLLRLENDLEVCGESDNAVDALAAISAKLPDVAVIDLALGHSSGLDLIKELRTHAPTTRVLVLSMHEEITDIERALRAGAQGYVMKRESTQQIVSAIREVYSGKIYAEPSVITRLAERVLARPTENLPTEQLLSERELDVFRRLGEGHSTRRIAEDLGISLKTIQTYCTRSREKLGLDDAAELTRAAVRWVERRKL